MNLYCIQCSKLTSNNNIEIKCDIDGKSNPSYYYSNFGFKKFETIDEEELTNLLKILNYI